MARAAWADTVDSEVEESPAFIQPNQFTGNVVDAEMPKALPLQDMKRFTHEETLMERAVWFLNLIAALFQHHASEGRCRHI